MIAFDPTAEAFARDPWSVYAALRAAPGPVRHEGLDAWLLARYEDVDAAARDPRLVRGQESFLDAGTIAAERRRANRHDMPQHERYVQASLIETDGADHDRLRLLVMRAFTRARVAAHGDAIERFVDERLDALLGAGEVDFVTAFAEAIPGHVIGEVLGVPAPDRPRLRGWSEDIVQFFDADRTEAHKQLAERATAEFQAYLAELVAERRRTPRDDLLTELVAAERTGALDETELYQTAMLVLMAGHGSTIDVLGTGLLALLEHPEAEARLRADPALLPTAVQEMFRYDSPLPYFHRFASEPVTIAGRRFETGTRFGLLYAAANRDPAAFPDPDRFDPSRTPNRHLAFGRGAHLCLGNHLSRLDAQIVFARLLARTRAIERTGTPRFRRSLTARGCAELRIRLSPA